MEKVKPQQLQLALKAQVTNSSNKVGQRLQATEVVWSRGL